MVATLTEHYLCIWLLHIHTSTGLGVCALPLYSSFDAFISTSMETSQHNVRNVSKRRRRVVNCFRTTIFVVCPFEIECHNETISESIFTSIYIDFWSLNRAEQLIIIRSPPRQMNWSLEELGLDWGVPNIFTFIVACSWFAVQEWLTCRANVFGRIEMSGVHVRLSAWRDFSDAVHTNTNEYFVRVFPGVSQRTQIMNYISTEHLPCERDEHGDTSTSLRNANAYTKMMKMWKGERERERKEVDAEKWKDERHPSLYFIIAINDIFIKFSELRFRTKHPTTCRGGYIVAYATYVGCGENSQYVEAVWFVCGKNQIKWLRRALLHVFTNAAALHA